MKIVPDDLKVVLDHAMNVFGCSISEPTCKDENSLIFQPVVDSKFGPDERYVKAFVEEINSLFRVNKITDKYQVSLDVLHMGSNIYRVLIAEVGG